MTKSVSPVEQETMVPSDAICGAGNVVSALKRIEKMRNALGKIRQTVEDVFNVNNKKKSPSVTQADIDERFAQCALRIQEINEMLAGLPEIQKKSSAIERLVRQILAEEWTAIFPDLAVIESIKSTASTQSRADTIQIDNSGAGVSTDSITQSGIPAAVSRGGVVGEKPAMTLYDRVKQSLDANAQLMEMSAGDVVDYIVDQFRLGHPTYEPRGADILRVCVLLSRTRFNDECWETLFTMNMRTYLTSPRQKGSSEESSMTMIGEAELAAPVVNENTDDSPADDIDVPSAAIVDDIEDMPTEIDEAEGQKTLDSEDDPAIATFLGEELVTIADVPVDDDDSETVVHEPITPSMSPVSSNGKPTETPHILDERIIHRTIAPDILPNEPEVGWSLGGGIGGPAGSAAYVTSDLGSTNDHQTTLQDVPDFGLSSFGLSREATYTLRLELSQAPIINSAVIRRVCDTVSYRHPGDEPKMGAVLTALLRDPPLPISTQRAGHGHSAVRVDRTDKTVELLLNGKSQSSRNDVAWYQEQSHAVPTNGQTTPHSVQEETNELQFDEQLVSRLNGVKVPEVLIGHIIDALVIQKLEVTVPVVESVIVNLQSTSKEIPALAKLGEPEALRTTIGVLIYQAVQPELMTDTGNTDVFDKQGIDPWADVGSDQDRRPTSIIDRDLFKADELEDVEVEELSGGEYEELESEYCGEFEEIDFDSLGIDPGAPTTAKPGTEEKVLMLAARYAAGVPLWHDEDSYDHGPGNSIARLIRRA